MIVAVWLGLLLLAVGSAAIGRLDVALVCAGGKALCVGWWYMELRSAARLHAAGFVAATVMVTVVLLLLLR